MTEEFWGLDVQLFVLHISYSYGFLTSFFLDLLGNDWFLSFICFTGIKKNTEKNIFFKTETAKTLKKSEKNKIKTDKDTK